MGQNAQLAARKLLLRSPLARGECARAHSLFISRKGILIRYEDSLLGKNAFVCYNTIVMETDVFAEEKVEKDKIVGDISYA